MIVTATDFLRVIRDLLVPLVLIQQLTLV
ncbi:hypothetical protein PCAR4_560016 [Paraburkholderia caribensis]|nr:hypothetical protein PCAR4_560016 [Paraburkholderia caribensis]